MSVIFNNTFSADKPIYYPSTWQSGKTAQQQYQQFKATFQFLILRNFVQIMLATAWVFLFYTVVLGVKEIYRISKLEDNSLQKIQNKQFIEQTFLYGVGFFSLTWLFITAVILNQDWGFIVLLKGIISFIVTYNLRNQILSILKKCGKFIKYLYKKSKKNNKLVQQQTS